MVAATWWSGGGYNNVAGRRMRWNRRGGGSTYVRKRGTAHVMPFKPCFQPYIAKKSWGILYQNQMKQRERYEVVDEVEEEETKEEERLWMRMRMHTGRR